MSVQKDLIIYRYQVSKAKGEPVEEISNKIIKQYRPLVWRIVSRFSPKKEQIEDLIQMGLLAIFRAIDRFDFSRNIAFSTFVAPNIIGEIRHFFRDKNRLVKIPRQLYELNTAIQRYIRLHKGEALEPASIAAALGYSEELILEAMEAGRNTTVLSLDTYNGPFSISDIENNYVGKNMALTAEDEQLDREMIKGEIARLKERDRLIMHYRFYEGLSQAEIGQKTGLTQMQVSREIRSILALLRYRCRQPKRLKKGG